MILKHAGNDFHYHCLYLLLLIVLISRIFQLIFLIKYPYMFNIKNIFNSFGFFRDLKRKDHKPSFGALDIFKYIGPGLLVTVGFIDPGNWAANIATGSELWIYPVMGCYSFNNYADCSAA